jgi:uncharacterized phage protein (TIGR01671 family)
MREIKFRAWDDGHRTMIYFDMWGRAIEPKSDMDIWSYEKRWRTTKNVYVMQFTGLHDKNGKEIYEGDVVRVLHRDKPYSLHYKEKAFNCEVYYDRDGAPGYRWPKDYGNYRVGENLRQCEIIGNIYENSDLLK